MRVLLLHPDDDPETGPWIRERWDRVFDLGVAGADTYGRWSALLDCPVESLPKQRLEDFDPIRQALAAGLGRMVDEHGLDWWDLISIRFHEPLERTIILRRFAEQISQGDQIFLSRAGNDAQALQLLLGRGLPSFFPAKSVSTRLRRAGSSILKFRPRQWLEILGDKYDAGYRVRRVAARRRKLCDRPLALLPTAYGNASRTAISYARAVPDQHFLLVATRQSGWMADPPRNVSLAWLASYAPGKYVEHEYQNLLCLWRESLVDFGRDRELSILDKLGAFCSVPALLREGLAIRNAWLQVFGCEPVTSVLCADEGNPYTRLPLLLAQTRGLPAMACHHGALDGRYRFRKNTADVILAKGGMEQDYLTNICGVPKEKVEIAAPTQRAPAILDCPRRKGSVVFFSEPYELAGGRCREFYAQVLPCLAQVAQANRRELVIKLHPYESRRERTRLAGEVLSKNQRKLLRMVDGPLSNELLQETWFGVTLCSTTAVDCALSSIPVFLCTWLDYPDYGYGDQFIKFGVATGLQGAEEIAEIPHRIESCSAKTRHALWQAASPERLRQLLFQNSGTARPDLPLEPAESVWA